MHESRSTLANDLTSFLKKHTGTYIEKEYYVGNRNSSSYLHEIQMCTNPPLEPFLQMT